MFTGHFEKDKTRKTRKVKKQGGRTVIRELRLEDYEQLLALWHKSGIKPNINGRESPEALERQLQAMGPFMLVAENSGDLVGVILGSHDGYEGFLDRVAVAPEYRKRGVARRLIIEAERRLEDKGIRKTVVVVEADGKESIGVFKKMGFEISEHVVYMVKRRNR
ncbi:MAG: GNAT family N-acetyltransferase [Deltaproteobacteria bacterium]|nr:GNAT family N-acetyltransferase [Deltaproteobacteria bacterium]